MMRTFFLLLCLLRFFEAAAQTNDTLRACLDSALVQAKSIALHRSTVSWEVVEGQIRQRAERAGNVLELRPAFTYLLEQLHDSHGRFFFQNKPVAWYHGTPEPHQQHIDPKIWAAIQSGKHPFQAALLPNQTGYLRISGMPMGNNAQLAEPILAAVCSLQTAGAKHWILDLRYNGGGNMYPMLAGLSAILGEGEVGGSMDADGNRFSIWEIKDGDVYYNTFLNADVENRCPVDGFPKVAVLTSRYTVSSGEVVAVAFKGRPNTRFLRAYSRVYHRDQLAAPACRRFHVHFRESLRRPGRAGVQKICTRGRRSPV
ncbi:MAG: S41 family peptidase [Lewinellaceae bacterium]|nr:S41 family peptidase [Lewinellaceae bacterium]